MLNPRPHRSFTTSLGQAAPGPAPGRPGEPKTTMTSAEGSTAALLTPDQAAEMLCVASSTLRGWRGSGDGPCYIRLTYKTIRYRREDVEGFVAGNLRWNTAVG